MLMEVIINAIEGKPIIDDTLSLRKRYPEIRRSTPSHAAIIPACKKIILNKDIIANIEKNRMIALPNVTSGVKIQNIAACINVRNGG